MKKVLFAAALAMPLFANAGGFAGIDFISSDIEPDNTTASAKPEALQFKFGSWINRDETLGGEVRLGLGVVKRGRLVGYHAGAAEGQLLTRPFTLSGRRLTLNVDARGGEVKAALADEEGRAIPGCSMGEAVPIREDGLDVPARWEGRADLTDLVGQRIRLRISAEDAKLYGLSMEDKEADLE